MPISTLIPRSALPLALLALFGCGDDTSAADSGSDAGHDAGPVYAPTQPAPVEAEPEVETTRPEIVNGMALVPSGSVFAGSLPGTTGRIARAEADAVSVSVPAFRIDVLPFGGDTPQVNVNRAQAAEMCAADGKRLCSELEWERACEGPANHRFAGGESYDPSASSIFGVQRMGAIGEWTSSPPVRDLAPGATDGAVFRGASADQDETMRRCNARRGTDGATQSRNLSFRCCQSDAAFDTPYPDERNRARFRPLGLSVDEVQAILRQVPALAAYADGFEFTSAEDTLARLGDTGLAMLGGWELAPSAMSWSPTAGDEVWVFHGVSNGRPSLLAVYPLQDDRFVHATSLVLEEDALPFIVAFTPPERSMLRWATEWNTTAESGVLALGEDSRISFEIR